MGHNHNNYNQHHNNADFEPATSVENTSETNSVEPEEVEVEEVVEVTVIADNLLNVRSSMDASSDSNILGQVRSGDVLQATGESDGWTTVNYNGQAAYVMSEFVQ